MSCAGVASAPGLFTGPSTPRLQGQLHQHRVGSPPPSSLSPRRTYTTTSLPVGVPAPAIPAGWPVDHHQFLQHVNAAASPWSAGVALLQRSLPSRSVSPVAQPHSARTHSSTTAIPAAALHSVPAAWARAPLDGGGPGAGLPRFGNEAARPAANGSSSARASAGLRGMQAAAFPLDTSSDLSSLVGCRRSASSGSRRADDSLLSASSRPVTGTLESVIHDFKRAMKVDCDTRRQRHDLDLSLSSLVDVTSAVQASNAFGSSVSTCGLSVRSPRRSVGGEVTGSPREASTSSLKAAAADAVRGIRGPGFRSVGPRALSRQTSGFCSRDPSPRGSPPGSPRSISVCTESLVVGGSGGCAVPVPESGFSSRMSQYKAAANRTKMKQQEAASRTGEKTRSPRTRRTSRSPPVSARDRRSLCNGEAQPRGASTANADAINSSFGSCNGATGRGDAAKTASRPGANPVKVRVRPPESTPQGNTSNTDVSTTSVVDNQAMPILHKWPVVPSEPPVPADAAAGAPTDVREIN
eukprot:TRINITY_DN77_c1_g1_i1.p1 TRINITY_DN77_c1_g1~~TRINITY_DN77_c1_g1_i1.p1  ORF type:complete len:524 (+),score=42.31 TRINITY_DN77_c1_g1_i1:856-2427(+)